MQNHCARGLASLAFALVAVATIGVAQAKKYAPNKGAATATVRFETTNSATRTSGRNYASVATFAPERCHQRNRKQAGMAYMNMRDRPENAVDAIVVEAGKPIVLSFLYLGITKVELDGDYNDRQCIVDGVATFAPGDRVLARFEIDAEVTQCKVTFISEATPMPAAPSTFETYPTLCWPDDSEREQASGVGVSTHNDVGMFPGH